MTASLAPPGPSTAPPAPPPVNGAGVVAGAPRGMRSRLGAALTTTPGRLRVESVVILVLAVVAGVVAFLLVGDRLADTRRIADQAAPVIVSARQVQTNLAEANAAAATAFVAGGVEDAGQRQLYEASLAAAATDLEAAIRLVGDDEASHDALRAMTAALPRYAGLIETARANNRQGFPVGAAYLNAATRLLEDEIYPATDLVANRAADSYRSAYDGQRNLGLVFAGVAAGLAALLVLVLVWEMGQLRRRFRRTINVPLAVAVVLALGLSGWLVGSLVNHTSRLTSARDDAYQGTRLYLDARGLAFGAKADEARFLIARGAGAPFEDSFQARAVLVDELRADLDAQAGSSPRASAVADVDAVYAAWDRYVDVHTQVVAADEANERDDAVALALNEASAAFAEFDAATTAALDAERAQFSSEMTAAENALRGLQYGSIVIVLLAAAVAAFGIQQRINEYR